MPVEMTNITNEELTDRAWLLGKMQTSLMRDGWPVIGTDPEAGTLDVVDNRLSFTVSLSIPVREKLPDPVAKKTTPKRKR